MAQYRMMVTLEDPNAVDASDYVVNTFYLDTDLVVPGDEDPRQLAQDAAELWSTALLIPSPLTRIRCRAYDMADATPREVKGEHVLTRAPNGVMAPREVACCLSYYADRNLPRQRGRIYIGPFNTGAMAMRPDAVIGSLQTLAEGISGLGGANVQWVQHHASPIQGEPGTFKNVTDYWIDNEWDTVRSRGLKGTSRTTGTVSG